MTHDSIGLGEDGPTHQPIEHFAALRAIPNLNMLRPADPIETAECWQIAMTSRETPTILALTRQKVPALRDTVDATNKCALGGYILKEAAGTRHVTLIATGSEVALAVAAADTLAGEGINAAIVSMPCIELFRTQDDAYRANVLGNAPRIAIEAGIAQGWHEWLRPDDQFIGLSDFGASAPIDQLFKHFNLTPERITQTARDLVKGAA